MIQGDLRLDFMYIIIEIALEPYMSTITLIDSHCHLNSLDLTAFQNKLSLVIEQAQAQDVHRFLSVCCEPSDVPCLLKIADAYSQVYISMGIHPNTEMEKEWGVEHLVDLAMHPQCIAIGETGLDYYRCEDPEVRDLQKQRFRAHIQASKRSKCPLIIHTRQAAEDTLQLLREEQAQDIGGVMHCFSEDWSVAKQALDLNFYISFSGIVTFKNAAILQDVAQKVPLNRMLIETDAPYLAPVPFRGQQNHPAFVKHVALKIAELRQMDYAQIAAQTTANFYQCFRISA